MRRPRAGSIAAIALLAAACVLWLWQGSRAAGESRSQTAPRAEAASAVASPAAPVAQALRFDRNPFAYAIETPRAAPPARPRPLPLPSQAPTPTPQPIAPAARLVGLVRRGTDLLCVVSLRGSVHVLGVGEEADGYGVVAVDEESVHLRAPDGSEVVLFPSR